jgi:RNA polymerase sigma-70 factor, ECF subfamily
VYPADDHSGGTVNPETMHGDATAIDDDTAAVLIEKIKSGDKGALLVLYDRSGPLLFGLICRIMGDRSRAEETLLDVYTRIWKESSFFVSGQSPLEWMIDIARRRAIAMLHWNRIDRKQPDFSLERQDSAMTVAPQRQRHARTSAGALVPMQREILDWAYFSGLSSSEIAARIGKPLGVVKTHTRLGLIRLSEESPH